MEKKLQHEQHITQQLRTLFKAVQLHSKEVEKSCGITSAKLWMLHEIFLHPGLRVSQLAKALVIHPSTCSNMLDKLEDQNLILRDRSKKDQRSVHLFLTEKGKQILDKVPGSHQRHLHVALNRLSIEQLGKLEQGLDDLLAALQGQRGDDQEMAISLTGR